MTTKTLSAAPPSKLPVSPLFQGISDAETRECLEALQAQEKSYPKGSIILHAGNPTDRMGLVLSGGVTMESNDVWGNRTILGHAGAGEVFAETYALLPEEIMLVDVAAKEDSRILFLTLGSRFINMTGSAWKDQLMKNLLRICAQKNLALSGRSFHTSPKSARGRLLSYLNAVALRQHADEFDIPFNRQQLADYLNLERTNMSKELGRMQRDGLLEFRKNHFHLLQTDDAAR